MELRILIRQLSMLRVMLDSQSRSDVDVVVNGVPITKIELEDDGSGNDNLWVNLKTEK